MAAPTFNYCSVMGNEKYEYENLPARVLIHQLKEIVTIDVPPPLNGLREHLHPLRVLGEVVQEGCLPTANVALHHHSKGFAAVLHLHWSEPREGLH